MIRCLLLAIRVADRRKQGLETTYVTRSGSGAVCLYAPRAEKASGDRGSFVSNSILNETKVQETISGFDLCMSALRTIQYNTTRGTWLFSRTINNQLLQWSLALMTTPLSYFKNYKQLKAKTYKPGIVVSTWFVQILDVDEMVNTWRCSTYAYSL